MSARAIRKLREERAAVSTSAKEEEEDSEEEDHHVTGPAKKSAFVMLNDDSSSDEDDVGDESDGGEKEEKEMGSGIHDDKNDDEKSEAQNDNKKTSPQYEDCTNADMDMAQSVENDENLDALLEEFKERDEKKQQSAEDYAATITTSDDCLESLAAFQILRANLDVRDLDVDHVMRTSLLNAEPVRDTNNKNKRRNRQTFLFGNPRDLNVNVKPPHYVGGGIGMSSYDRETTADRTIPWPYSRRGLATQDATHGMTNVGQTTTLQPLQDRRRWFTFIHSDTYEKDVLDFKRIQASGDMNALVMFVAHHPFATEALVTLGMMLYQCNQAQEGLTFLRRALWIYESATLTSFSSSVFDDSCFMDYHQPENKTYFSSLFRLARVTHMSGLSRASIAIGRYLLSLDPLRDPTGVLLALDCYALATDSDLNYQWIVDMVQNQQVVVFYKDETTAQEYCCNLRDLPNWAYSYALALYRLNDSRASDDANEAIKAAIGNFPSIVDLLLKENDVDVTSRSCRNDWQTVIDYTGSRANAIHGSLEEEIDPVVRMVTQKAYDLVSRIFSKLNCKLWAGDDVMLWLFNSLHDLKDNPDSVPVRPLSPALMRYSRADPDDYATKFQLLPAEANPLDMGLVNHALVIDPNRRRFLRHQQRGGRMEDNVDFDQLFMLGQGNAAAFF